MDRNSSFIKKELVYVDVSYQKPASQSSFSIWSTSNNESANALSGPLPSSFSFHTDREINPWWVVDLMGVFPIDFIRVFNRQDAEFGRARTLKIEVSVETNDEWTTVYSSLDHFDKIPPITPLELYFESRIYARYVRCSLSGFESLHLAKIQVFVEVQNFLSTAVKFLDRSNSYNIVGHENSKIRGVEILANARFGNVLLKCMNAIIVAEKSGLDYVKICHHELLSLTEPLQIGNITLFPFEKNLPLDCSIITGAFFDYAETPFFPLLAPMDHPNENDYSRVGREIIRPYLLKNININTNIDTKQLTIHLRSGDIFTGSPDSSGYRQPPLSFYTLIINKMLDEDKIDKVLLVFEDRGNPCIEALEYFLSQKGIAYRNQCGNLSEDLSALIDAAHLVFGFGTFGYAVCRLSSKIQTLFFFYPELCGRYADIPVIEDVYCISDSRDEYFRAFEKDWHNLPEQRKAMIEYPEENLFIKNIKNKY